VIIGTAFKTKEVPKVPADYKHLFSEMDITPLLEKERAKLKSRVEGIPENKLLNASEHDLMQSLVEEFRLEVPVLKDEDRYVEPPREVRVDMSHNPLYDWGDGRPAYVRGNEVVIIVPFEGSAEFFKIRPNRFSLSPPRARVGEGVLRLSFTRADNDGAAVKRDSDNEIKSINDYLDWLREVVTPHNNQLESGAQTFIKHRKDRLLAAANMATAVGLPMKRREGAPDTYAVPVKRRVPKIEEIKVEGVFKPEPALAMSDYEEILRIMQNMAQVRELSPHVFETLGEEDLRTHFLVPLNGHYEGHATGETFNFQGKTDILIRVNGRNVFIAECKFWSGEKAYLETIDQLLSYLSWRDTKAAVVVFNRNADFSAVLGKISAATPKHAHFKREVDKPGETMFRYIFGQPSDPNREITLTVMAFDVPKTQ
jgi:hypothetical protein